MVDLPFHDDSSGFRAEWARAFRQWLQRDLNETRPLSLGLAVVPLLPAIAADKLGFSEPTTTVLFALGGLLAVGWFGYILVRHIGLKTRRIKRQFSDFEAQKRGEELPTRCPECGVDLPSFEPPKDGRIYRFAGWECENCGTTIDQLGHYI